MDFLVRSVLEPEQLLLGLESEELLRILFSPGLVRMELKLEVVVRLMVNLQLELEDNRAIHMTNSSVLSREVIRYGVCVIWEHTKHGRISEP